MAHPLPPPPQFPTLVRLRELHLELGSMSIAEQRSLIRGLSMSGLLPQLEKVTLGDGTTSYVRSPGRGPGRDLFAVCNQNKCSFLFFLWRVVFFSVDIFR